VRTEVAELGLLISPVVGYLLDFSNGSNRPIFVVAGTAYLIAFTIIHTFVPRLKGSH
jgi:MFS transporter, ACS family, hexuronate transporter